MLSTPEIAPLSLACELSPQYEQYVGLDKTFARVCLSLDSQHGYTDSQEILAPFQGELPKDTTDYIRALDDYAQNRPIRVGEGGANLRSFLYRMHKDGLLKEFVKEGSLVARPIYEGADIVVMTNAELASLDKKSTQYLSARLVWDQFAELTESDIKRDFKLQVVLDAIEHWYTRRELGLPWEPRRDISLARQAASYIQSLQTGQTDPNYYPEQAEDYCFARAYGLMSPAEALARWPKLQGHESNRIESMERAIKQAERGEIIDVNDHRVVQAIAMRFGLGQNRFKHPECVTKSWPRFWEFVAIAHQQNGVYQWQPT